MSKRPDGAGAITSHGYIQMSKGGKLFSEHLIIAEAALGRKIPPGVQVHHVDENRMNNANSNLVICPTQGYHRLLHRRAKALDQCGHADWRVCWVCKNYDSEDKLKQDGRRSYSHPHCKASHRAKYNRGQHV